MCSFVFFFFILLIDVASSGQAGRAGASTFHGCREHVDTWQAAPNLEQRARGGARTVFRVTIYSGAREPQTALETVTAMLLSQSPVTFKTLPTTLGF